MKSKLSWENSKQFYAIAVDSSQPNTLYMGTDGGVLKSTDGSETWTLINSNLRAASISNFAQVKATPDVKYAIANEFLN